MKTILFIFTFVFIIVTVMSSQETGAGCGYHNHGLRELSADPAVTMIRFTPAVINHDAKDSVLLEIKISATPTKVLLRVDGNAINLRDDGLSGDKVSKDNVFTIRYAASSIISRLKPDDVFRPFLGYAEIYNGDVKVSQYNVFPIVRTPDIPDVAIERKSTTVQATSRIVNIVSVNNKEYVNAHIDNAKIFYKYYDDNFDFLAFVHVPGYVGNRNFASIRTTVSGIGLPITDATQTYGSAGRLKGRIEFPLLSFYDGAVSAYSHEIGHYWINFLPPPPLKSGVPHWPISSLASSTMGFSIGGSGGAGGQFPFVFKPAPGGYTLTQSTAIGAEFSKWDLYLMGLISPSEVTDTALIFNDQSKVPGTGFYAHSAFTKYTMQDLLRDVGSRSPNQAASQKEFRVGTIVLSDHLLNAAEMAYLDYMTARAELKDLVNTADGFAKQKDRPFYLATQGKGTLKVNLTNAPSGVKDEHDNIKIALLPNPFDNVIDARWDDVPDEPINVWLVDGCGRILRQAEWPKGEKQMTLETSFIPSGMYFFQIQSPVWQRTLKVVK
jgi:hypothetical protein